MTPHARLDRAVVHAKQLLGEKLPDCTPQIALCEPETRLNDRMDGIAVSHDGPGYIIANPSFIDSKTDHELAVEVAEQIRLLVSVDVLYARRFIKAIGELRGAANEAPE